MIIFFIAVVAVSLFFISNLINAVVVGGIVSGLAALFYVFNLAPDVAITEAAVGSAISSIFFIISIASIKKDNDNENINFFVKTCSAILCLFLFIGLCYLALKLPKYGSQNNIIHGGISDYYLQNTKTDFGISNIVTAILGGYRGLDTLFETAVIFSAAMGVKAIFSKDEV